MRAPPPRHDTRPLCRNTHENDNRLVANSVEERSGRPVGQLAAAALLAHGRARLHRNTRTPLAEAALRTPAHLGKDGVGFLQRKTHRTLEVLYCRFAENGAVLATRLLPFRLAERIQILVTKGRRRNTPKVVPLLQGGDDGLAPSPCVQLLSFAGEEFAHSRHIQGEVQAGIFSWPQKGLDLIPQVRSLLLPSTEVRQDRRHVGNRVQLGQGFGRRFNALVFKAGVILIDKLLPPLIRRHVRIGGKKLFSQSRRCALGL